MAHGHSRNYTTLTDATGPFGSAVTKASYIPMGYKVYGQQEVVAKSYDAEAYFISKQTFEQLKSCDVRPGDILMTMMGTIGRVYLVPPDAPLGIINPRLVRISVDQSRLTPQFATILLEQTWVQRLLQRRSQGGTMPGLNLDALASIKLTFPSLPTQHRIAEILRTWDEAIEKLGHLRLAKESLRRWIRTHVVAGKVRLPRFSGEWRSVQLSKVLTEHGENSTGKEEVYSVSVRKGLVNQIEHLGRSFAAASTDHYNRVLPGDIVYTKSPTGEFPLGIIKQSRVEHPVIVSPLYGVFSPIRRELGILIEAHFEAPLAVSNYLNPLVQKGAKNTIAITNKRFLEGRLRLPLDPQEQIAIAAILETSRRELDAIDREIVALTRQKRGLMQKLLTGAWPVHVDGEAK